MEVASLQELQDAERQQLRAAYATTGGPRLWTMRTGWEFGCNWNVAAYYEGPAGCHGVGLKSGRVTSLLLPSNGLEGTLGSLTALDRLVRLELNDNALTGRLPALGVCDVLTTLDLGHNRLTSEDLTDLDLSKTKSLTWVSLADNRLTWRLPTSRADHWSFYLCKSLVHLDLSKNRVSGPLIDKGIKRLKRLETLDLSSNRLSGPLPGAGLAKLKSRLKWLTLSDNRFNGNLPLQHLEVSAARPSGDSHASSTDAALTHPL